MKNFLYFAAIIFLNSFAFGQDTRPEGSVAVISSAKAQSEIVIREKFDPTRDTKIDLAKAIETASKNGKHIILDVGGEWCGWCVYMNKFFVQNSPLAKIRDENFVWVKINFSEENENKTFLSSYPEPSGYPHLYVLDSTGKLLHSHDTSALEKGKGYDLTKFTNFLRAWSPKKKPEQAPATGTISPLP